MTITLGSNIASLRGQRQLAKTENELSSVFERLASGQRINRASDDAAGIAIADSLRADAKILDRASKNLSDGLSLINIADAAIENLSGIVLRIEELAAQAANGVYSKTQRAALDNEAQALSDEFLRVTKSAEFNGRRLFTGETPLLSLQAGRGEHSALTGSLGGALGTGSFSARTSIATGSGSHSSVIADFNGDGLNDIATTNVTGNSVSININQGGGSFAASVNYSLGASESLYIISEDFNNDGVLDLATADRNTASVSVLIGKGDGTFRQRISYAVAHNAVELESGDFNGDGIADLATTHYGNGQVGILLGQGNGGFTNGQLITTSAQAWPIAVGDINNDGADDLITGGTSVNDVRIFLGRGDGSFNAGQLLPGVAWFVGDVQLGDFNNDDRLDLAVVDGTNDLIHIYTGAGNGTFSAGAQLDLPSPVNSGTAAIADVNGDGNLDILSAERQENRVGVFLGNGDATFSAELTFAALGSDVVEVQAGDLDGDGVLDLVTNNRLTSDISLLFANVTSGINAILPFSLQTVADARQALPMLKLKREQLSSQRSVIGAFSSRITTAQHAIEAARENFIAAESRIRDADIAYESSRLARLSILQQSAASVLAQANIQPQLALALLR